MLSVPLCKVILDVPAVKARLVVVRKSQILLILICDEVRFKLLVCVEFPTKLPVVRFLLLVFKFPLMSEMLTRLFVVKSSLNSHEPTPLNTQLPIIILPKEAIVLLVCDEAKVVVPLNPLDNRGDNL